MTAINPHSKFGYLALKKESVEGTAVKPDVYFELLSEEIMVNWIEQSISPIAGAVDLNRRTVHGKVSVSGTITFPIETKTLGYVLTNFFGLPTTTTIVANKVYEHVFLPRVIPPTYTMDIRLAADSLVRRYVGVKISQLEISQSDNRMQATITITALKAFTEARITTTTVSATQLHLDQTNGVTTSDVVEFRDADDFSNVNHTASVSAITSETIITLAGAVSASVGDVMTIRRSTPSYDLSEDLIWVGGAKYTDGKDINNAETVNNTEDASYTFKREAEERHAVTGINVINRFPAKILLKGFDSEGSFQHYYQSPKYSEKTRRGAKTGLRTRIYGAQLDTNSAKSAVLKFGSGNGLVWVTSSVASETANNLNITVIENTADTLTAIQDGNDITVKLANTTTTSNTATLVAAAIHALSKVNASAGGTGANEVSTMTKTNLGTGAYRRGRDASEKELLRLDFFDARFQPFGQNNSEDNIVDEEIKFKGIVDTVSDSSVRVLLRNAVTTYA